MANCGIVFAEFFSELSCGGTSKSEILGGKTRAVNAHPNIGTLFAYMTRGGVTRQIGATAAPIQGSNAPMFYDYASASVVSTPSTIALLGLGGCGLVTLRRRGA